MRSIPLHLQMQLFEPAKDAASIPPRTRRRLLPLMIALLSEAADANEPTAKVEANDD